MKIIVKEGSEAFKTLVKLIKEDLSNNVYHIGDDVYNYFYEELYNSIEEDDQYINTDLQYENNLGVYILHIEGYGHIKPGQKSYDYDVPNDPNEYSFNVTDYSFCFNPNDNDYGDCVDTDFELSKIF